MDFEPFPKKKKTNAMSGHSLLSLKVLRLATGPPSAELQLGKIAGLPRVLRMEVFK